MDNQSKLPDFIDLFWALVYQLNYKFIFLFVFFVWFFGNLINPAMLGARSYLLAVLFAFFLIEINRSYVQPAAKGEETDTLWVKVIMIPTLLIAAFEAKFLWQQSVGTELTHEISANYSSYMECQRFVPALLTDSLRAGYYAPSEDKNRSVIQYTYCNKWSEFYYTFDKENITDIRILWAVGTVIHEAIHVSGELNEAVTQCLTFKAYPNILRKFAISEKKIKEYTAIYMESSEKMPREYKGGKCESHPLIDKVPYIFQKI